MGVGKGEADVVGQRAHVGGVVVEAFELEYQGAQPVGRLGHLNAEGVFDGKAVCQRVTGRGVTADAFRQVGGVGGTQPLEELLHPTVGEPESGLELEDGLPDDREAEVSGFDDAGVDGSHRDLIDPVADHGDERVGLGVGERRRRSGVVEHRVPPGGPVGMADQSAGQGVVEGLDPEQVVHLTFEPRGGEGQRGQRGQGRVVRGQRYFQLDAAIRGAGQEQVDHAQGGAVVVGCDQAQAEPVLEQRLGLFAQLGWFHAQGDTVRPDPQAVVGGAVAHVRVIGHLLPPSRVAAVWKSSSSGPMVRPRTRLRMTPVTRATETERGTAIAGDPGAGGPRIIRAPLRTIAAKATTTSSSAAPSTHPRPASASARELDGSLAHIANGGSPSRITRPTAKLMPIIRDRANTPVTSLIWVESCAACSCPAPRNTSVFAIPWARTCSSRAAIASLVPAAAATATNPMFSMEEYASIRLKSVWTTSSEAAISRVSSPTMIRSVRRNPVPTARSTTDLTRSSA